MTAANQDKNKDILNILKKATEALEIYQRSASSDQYTSIEQLGEVIRSERKKQKVSQELLGKLSGVSIGVVISIESGKMTPSLFNVQKVLQALGKKIWIK